MLLDLVAEQAARQGRGVDRDARELRQDVGQPADVVLVGVGDQERLDVGPALLEVGHVGMTRSMPNISSSGNISPQSITTISSPYSKTYMFLPISPTPPSGMIRSGGSTESYGPFRWGQKSVIGRVGSRLVRGQSVGASSGR